MGLDDTGRIEEAARVSCGWPQDQCCKGCCTVETSGIINDPPDIVLKMQRVSPDEVTVAAQFPDLAQEAAGEALAARAASKDDDITAQEPGARREIDDRFALQASAALVS